MSRKCKVLLAGLLVVVLAPMVGAQKAERRKVAEGEYLMKIDDEGEQMEYRDRWTLWLVGESYEVHSRVRLSVDNEPVQFQTIFRLDAQLRVESVRISGGFPGRFPGMMPQRSMTVEVTDREVRWSVEKEHGKLPVEERHEVLLPLPWFVNSIVRRATQNLNAPTTVPLAFLDDGTDEALELIPLKGTVTFLGTEEIRVAEQWVLAEKYEIRPEDMQAMLVYTSREGILLKLCDPKKGEALFELVQYKRHDVGP